MNLSQYIDIVDKRFKSGISREHSYRADLEGLIRELVPGVDITNEPANVTDCGNPDYVITKGKIPIGFIEAKDVGKDLNGSVYKEQFTRYRKALDNLIITDYLWFRFYQNGELEEIQTQTGIRVRGMVFDDDGNILDATLIYPDQTIEIIRNGTLLRRIALDQSVTDFLPNGQIAREISVKRDDKGTVLQRTVSWYRYEKESQELMLGLEIWTSAGDSVLYDAEGAIREITAAGGTHYIYDKADAGAGATVTLNMTLSSEATGNTLTEIRYDLAGALSAITFRSARRQTVLARCRLDAQAVPPGKINSSRAGRFWLKVSISSSRVLMCSGVIRLLIIPAEASSPPASNKVC